MTHNVCSRRTRTALTASMLVAAFWAPVVWADEYGEVNRLLRAGQPTEAMAKADQFLASKPRDPQMRFLKGVVLAETGKTNDAITTFVKLTEEFPELPEPYNNLAVLYASQSQFDKARVALEMAIRTNPSYATAHENLGDVYAKLASQAYSKALQLDGSNAGVPPKLALIRNLFAPDSRARPVALAPASASAAPASATLAPATKPAAATPAAPVPPTTIAAQSPATATPAVPSAQPAASGELIAAVEAWAKAWADKDMAGYLAAYSADFDPPGRQSRRAWEATRTSRIVSKNSISVDVSDFDVKVDGDKAVVRFRQNYKSGRLVANSRKTLDMVKQGGRWLIVREDSGG